LDNGNSYSLILSDCAANLKPMASVLRESSLFDSVQFFPCEKYQSYYRLYYCQFPKNVILKALTICKNHWKLIRRQKDFKNFRFPFDLDFSVYDKIICTEGPYITNAYLATNHMYFTVTEQAKNHIQTLSIQAALFYWIIAIFDKMKILTGIRFSTKYCNEIIVNSADGITGLPAKCVNGKKITVWNVEENIAKLDTDQKDRIYSLYAKAYHLNLDYNRKYDLLLTNPLYEDSYLPSETSHVNFYKDMIEKHFSNPVLIKPHPRDHVDYKKYFPETIVIDKNISSEILAMSNRLRLSTVLTVFSTSGGAFKEKAENLVILSKSIFAHEMPFLQPYKEGVVRDGNG